MKKSLLLVLISYCISLAAQDKQFHETGGFGTDKTYGIGGQVYTVTNLNGDGPGSLRSYLEMSGDRIIIFEVGGIIDLNEESITIGSGSVTVAGQTAPEPGITLIKGGLKVRASEVLIQHITIRVGDAGYTGPVGWEPDGFNVTTKNVVFDHCSVSWGVDENMSVSRGGNNVTFYRCIIAEGLSNGIHFKGEHSCGSLVMDNSKEISIIGCYYAHNFRRHPRLKDGTEVLYANNVVYNYGIYAAHIGGEQGEGYSTNPGVGNFIGNAFFKGQDGWDNYFVEGHKGDFDKTMNPGNGEAYLEDNIMVDRISGDQLISHDEHITILSSANNLPKAFVAEPAYENIDLVLTHAGANPAYRSDEDKRLIEDLINGTGSIIDSQEEVGGYPEYDATTRTLTNIPESATERREWLDSISASIEVDSNMNTQTLYDFLGDPQTNLTSTNVNELQLKAYPNPAQEYVIVSFKLEKESTVQISIVNIIGEIIYLQEDLQGQHGFNRHQINLEAFNLPEGVYQLRVETKKENKTTTIVVE